MELILSSFCYISNWGNFSVSCTHLWPKTCAQPGGSQWKVTFPTAQHSLASSGSSLCCFNSMHFIFKDLIQIFMKSVVCMYACISINKSIFWTYLAANLIFLLRLPVSLSSSSVCVWNGKRKKKPNKPTNLWPFQLLTVSISPWEKAFLLSLMLRRLLNKQNERRCFLAGDTVHKKTLLKALLSCNFCVQKSVDQTIQSYPRKHLVKLNRLAE